MPLSRHLDGVGGVGEFHPLREPFGWKWIGRLGLAIFDWFVILFVGCSIELVTRILCRLEVKGKENIPKSGPVLVLARHRSVFGIFALEEQLVFPGVLLRPWMFPINVAKQKYVISVGRYLRWLAHRFNVIELPEEEDHFGRQGVVAGQIDILASRNEGAFMVLFPTGKRDDPAERGLAPFRAGVGRVVAEAKPKIIFVWDDDTALAWPKGQNRPPLPIRWWGWLPLPSRAPVKITISRPINAADPSAPLFKLCQNQPLTEVGQPVANYLHDLCWEWVLSFQRELEAVSPQNGQLS